MFTEIKASLFVDLLWHSFFFYVVFHFFIFFYGQSNTHLPERPQGMTQTIVWPQDCVVLFCLIMKKEV